MENDVRMEICFQCECLQVYTNIIFIKLCQKYVIIHSYCQYYYIMHCSNNHSWFIVNFFTFQYLIQYFSSIILKQCVSDADLSVILQYFLQITSFVVLSSTLVQPFPRTILLKILQKYKRDWSRCKLCNFLSKLLHEIVVIFVNF
jgi:hypothetical protein